MAATPRSRRSGSNAASSFVFLLAAALLPLSACGGGGGGSAPGLQLGVDLNGGWSVEVVHVASSGSCLFLSEGTSAFAVLHEPATGTFALADTFDGTLRGLEATMAGVIPDTDGEIGYQSKLTFVADGSSFTGTLSLAQAATGCSLLVSLRGVRAMTFDVQPSQEDLDYDDPIQVVFDRPVDVTTIATGEFDVSISRTSIPIDVRQVAPSVVEIVPVTMLPVDAAFSVRVTSQVRSLDGRACSSAPVTRRTKAFSEEFRYRIESPDGQVALDTDINHDTLLSIPNNTSGQRWRFNRFGSGTPALYLLRNDLFGSQLALEGSDGANVAVMQVYGIPASGQRWYAPTSADGFRLRNEFLPDSSLVRTSPLPGGTVLNASGSDPEGTWVLRPLERIVDGVPSIALRIGERIDAALATTDPTGLRDVDRFTNLYEFELAFTATVTFTMRSSVVDSWLVLLSDDTYDDTSLVEWRRSILGEDDDAGGADLGALSLRDARLQQTLAPGRYFVAATTFGANVTGAYQLEATAVESAPGATPTLVPLVGAGRATTAKKY